MSADIVATALNLDCMHVPTVKNQRSTIRTETPANIAPPPELKDILRSSRVKFWVPQHLIDSLNLK